MEIKITMFRKNCYIKMNISEIITMIILSLRFNYHVNFKNGDKIKIKVFNYFNYRI